MLLDECEIAIALMEPSTVERCIGLLASVESATTNCFPEALPWNQSTHLISVIDTSIEGNGSNRFRRQKPLTSNPPFTNESIAAAS